MKIGNVNIDGNLILGPMAGVTDLPFRMLCKEQGCGLLYSEMVSAKAVLYNNKNTDKLIEYNEKEHPIAIQLFGSDPDIMADMAKRIWQETGCDIIDVNMGCPVPKVVNNGEGSALMKNPQKAGKILEAMVKAVEIPVTVKIRKGFDKDSINGVEMAKIAEACGVAAVAVHGRTREEYYTGKADWSIIREVKEAVKIPVIGSGDVFCPEDAGKMQQETGVDGIMIARGARGNPWIFSRTSEYLKTGRLLPKPDMEEVKKMIMRHATMEVEFKGEYTGIREMRKHVAWYTTGMPGSSALRRAVNEVETLEALRELLYRQD